ncbi:recombinase family protein [Mycobacterium sp. D16Q16]|uniref:recombinase family protein n=1 Tax=Mycobacterium sp. D16Q16 TaxID=1855659 RepID=UPI0009928FF4|nr:recombinase family protein [Mycobacterium sp. D16Q16]
MTGQRVGYVRVSTIDQNVARQLDGLEVTIDRGQVDVSLAQIPETQLDGVALDRVFIDQASGKDTNRPQLEAALTYVREGDTLVVHSMDRLARNLEDLRRLVRELTGRGVKVEFVKEGLTFTGEDSPMSTLLLSMLGAVAEFERSMIRERQREGIEIAKAKGVYKGRKPALTDVQTAVVLERLAAGESPVDLASEFGVSRATVYNVRARAATEEDRDG